MPTRRLPTLLLTLLTLALLGGSVASGHDDRDRDDRDQKVERFATLPKPGPGFPEGIAADRDGNIYVSTFDFNEPNNIYVFRRDGRPKTTFPVCGGAGAGCGLNAITFDSAGNLYVSDSFGGNGLAFNKSGTQLFIANTADDRILKYDLALEKVTVFAQSINGADGIAFDHRGRLWVCANQGDELVALNDRGRIVERRGSFEGIGRDGAPKGLLVPASLVISRGAIYVTNLALPLTNEPGAEGDEPEEDVTTYTVSRIKLD